MFNSNNVIRVIPNPTLSYRPRVSPDTPRCPRCGKPDAMQAAWTPRHGRRKRPPECLRCWFASALRRCS